MKSLTRGSFQGLWLGLVALVCFQVSIALARDCDFEKLAPSDTTSSRFAANDLGLYNPSDPENAWNQPFKEPSLVKLRTGLYLSNETVRQEMLRLDELLEREPQAFALLVDFFQEHPSAGKVSAGEDADFIFSRLHDLDFVSFLGNIRRRETRPVLMAALVATPDGYRLRSPLAPTELVGGQKPSVLADGHGPYRDDIALPVPATPENAALRAQAEVEAKLREEAIEDAWTQADQEGGAFGGEIAPDVFKKDRAFAREWLRTELGEQLDSQGRRFADMSPDQRRAFVIEVVTGPMLEKDLLADLALRKALDDLGSRLKAPGRWFIGLTYSAHKRLVLDAILRHRGESFSRLTTAEKQELADAAANGLVMPWKKWPNTITAIVGPAGAAALMWLGGAWLPHWLAVPLGGVIGLVAGKLLRGLADSVSMVVGPRVATGALQRPRRNLLTEDTERIGNDSRGYAGYYVGGVHHVTFSANMMDPVIDFSKEYYRSPVNEDRAVAHELLALAVLLQLHYYPDVPLNSATGGPFRARILPDFQGTDDYSAVASYVRRTGSRYAMDVFEGVSRLNTVLGREAQKESAAPTIPVIVDKFAKRDAVEIKLDEGVKRLWRHWWNGPYTWIIHFNREKFVSETIEGLDRELAQRRLTWEELTPEQQDDIIFSALGKTIGKWAGNPTLLSTSLALGVQASVGYVADTLPPTSRAPFGILSGTVTSPFEGPFDGWANQKISIWFANNSEGAKLSDTAFNRVMVQIGVASNLMPSTFSDGRDKFRDYWSNLQSTLLDADRKARDGHVEAARASFAQAVLSGHRRFPFARPEAISDRILYLEMHKHFGNQESRDVIAAMIAQDVAKEVRETAFASMEDLVHDGSERLRLRGHADSLERLVTDPSFVAFAEKIVEVPKFEGLEATAAKLVEAGKLAPAGPEMGLVHNLEPLLAEIAEDETRRNVEMALIQAAIVYRLESRIVIDKLDRILKPQLFPFPGRS